MTFDLWGLYISLCLFMLWPLIVITLTHKSSEKIELAKLDLAVLSKKNKT